jgi:hypothetical protein
MKHVISNQGGKLDINVKRAVSFSKALQFTDDDDIAIDITGRTYTAKVYREGEEVAEFTATITVADEGRIALTMDHAVTSSLDVRPCEWELIETNGAAKKQWLYGKLTAGDL